MSDRMRKVNSTMLTAVAQHVALLKDPRIGFVTITSVDTSPNLRRAVVYYSVLGTAEEVESTGEGLESAAPRISRAVGAESSMKYTPTLRFELDKAAERSASLTEIFKRLSDEEPPNLAEQDDTEEFSQ